MPGGRPEEHPAGEREVQVEEVENEIDKKIREKEDQLSSPLASVLLQKASVVPRALRESKINESDIASLKSHLTRPREERTTRIMCVYRSRLMMCH